MAERLPRCLIEVDLPIARISAHARREKSIRHGHISTLHIWWARRPLAACRAVVLAALLPDPADDACPQAFRDAAVRALSWRRSARDDRAGLRTALLDFIAEFSNWDLAAHPDYLRTARALVAAAYPDGRPTVLDPFAGGGAIPLEALRVGADAWASDVNPVAVLLEKVVLEYVPRFGQRLADGVRKWGAVIREAAEERIGRFYPVEPDGSVPIAYLWARTALCEGPGCGARVPLMRGMWLAKRLGRNVAMRPRVEDGQVRLELLQGARLQGVGTGTVKRGSLMCPVCGYTTPVKAIRKQAREHGLPERLIAVVTTKPGHAGRRYRLAETRDVQVAAAAEAELERQIERYEGPLSLVPDEPLPPRGTLGFRVQGYGFKTWGDLFTPRQKLALSTLARLVQETHATIVDETRDEALARAITTCLALAVDRAAETGSSLCRWNSVAEKIQGTFGRQALPVVWDFAESNPFGGSVGEWSSFVHNVLLALDTASTIEQSGTAISAGATNLPYADASVNVLATDPPYYDAVPYADLSDYFYVWLRRSLADVYPDLLASILTIKDKEIVMNPAAMVDSQIKDSGFFESSMTSALREAWRVLDPSGIGIVVFAHKTTAGWEAMLQALVSAGWTVTGSWPIDTEMGSRLRAMNSAALASSVHLVCRPRPADAGIGDWGSILRQLQPRTDEWMRRLTAEGVVGADAIFACLGPALELYSRYEHVETAGGVEVPLGGRSASGDDFLSHVWAAVARSALRTIFNEAEAADFEPDGRLAAVWLWTVNAGRAAANGERDDEDEAEEPDDEESARPPSRRAGFVLPFDTARKLAQPLGADLLVIGRRPGAAFDVKGEDARMLPVLERRRFLIGADGEAVSVARPAQQTLFDEDQPSFASVSVRPGDTTLDRVQQAMLLFAEERGEALNRLLVADRVGNDQRFWTLANALSALYPKTSPEKRWVDGLLARRRARGGG